MRESRSKNHPTSKWNDKLRHKDIGLVVHARQCNRRERYSARREATVAAHEALLESLLDRIISVLCKEAGI